MMLQIYSQTTVIALGTGEYAMQQKHVRIDTSWVSAPSKKRPQQLGYRILVNMLLSITLRNHGTGIFTYIWLMFMVNVGEIYHTWMV